MPLALWTLIWLNFRAVLRKTGRQLRTVRGIIFFIIGVAMLGLWVGRSVLLNAYSHPPEPSSAMTAAPAAIFLLCVVNLFMSAGERAVTFTPAEVDFLFPGPFTRRQLLTYKLVKTALIGIFSALIFSVVLGRLGGTFLCRLIGVWLLFQFFQLLAMVFALLQTSIGERLFAVGRRWLLVVLGVAVMLAAIEVYRSHPKLSTELLTQARDTTAGKIVLAPFKIFAHALLAREFFFDGMRWMAIALGIDLAMVAVVFGLDADYLETSASVSARRYDRLARVRRSGVGGMAKATSSRWKLPMLPWLAGTGPIIWRQLTTAIRTARTLLIILIVAAIAGGFVISQSGFESGSIGFFVGIVLFLLQMLKFDFRGDLDHLDVLRSLPLRASAVAAAQLVAPALILSLAELVLLLTIAGAGHFPLVNLILVGMFGIPFIVLALSVENLLFLMYPMRAPAAIAGDMAMVGRRTIMLSCRMIIMLFVSGIAVAAGLCAWVLTHHSLALTAMAAWVPLLAAIMLIVWLTAVVYGRFDPSVNTPT